MMSTSKKATIILSLPPIKARNPLAHHPLMRKGGAHDTSPSTVRQKTKQNIHKALQDESD